MSYDLKKEKTISFSIQSDEKDQRLDIRAYRYRDNKLLFEGTIYVEELIGEDMFHTKQERMLEAEHLAKEIMRAIIDEGM